MKPSLKRLAKDHISLHKALPPNYLFPPASDSSTPSLPDDLTSLTILLTGPDSTPFSAGLFTLRLSIPLTYPQSPPTATFLTRIFHPNVAEESGSVCVETLKRDWRPELTLRDVLVTISCLLIQPNPDSALNQKVGALIQEDFEQYARQARLMTKIHAPIPQDLQQAVDEAKQRGEDISTTKNGATGVLQETQLAGTAAAEIPKTADGEKSAKRALDAEPGQENVSKQDRRRKSPKHNHVSDATTSFGSEAVQSRPTTGTTMLEKPVDEAPAKTVFQASWSRQKSKVRIGIRRL